jgi:hypothetical protein
MMTVAEGRGATRQLRRMSTEMWWARLGQKIRGETGETGETNVGETGERHDHDMVCQRERKRADGRSRNGGREWHGGRD